jgi:hypothetical protein
MCSTNGMTAGNVPPEWMAPKRCNLVQTAGGRIQLFLKRKLKSNKGSSRFNGFCPVARLAEWKVCWKSWF